MNDKFQMTKEWKLAAYLCVKGLRNPDVYFNLTHLYRYLKREEILTHEEIQEFEKLMRTVTSVASNLEKELFKDDEIYKEE